jgi:glutathione-regulated potassium-efflux system protein KefB
MRTTVFGLGGLQVLISGLLLAVLSVLFGMGLVRALFIGLALSLSSTAFALQVLEENGELSGRHGRLAFAILLFQDLAAIPLIALAPLFAVSTFGSRPAMDLGAAGFALITIALVVLVGRFAVDPLLRFVARARVKEAMTAAALLVVVAVSLVMQKAGLSASLGAFIAGALLADSSYRHQLEADLKPFEGLLLGLFFTAVGMALNLSLLFSKPGTILIMVLAMLLIKAGVLYALGLWQKLEPWGARRMALSLSQGGEFAFVLFAAGVGAGVLTRGSADLLSVVVTLSMAATPLLLVLDTTLLGTAPKPIRAFDTPPEASGHVIIAGFGRFGQIAARILRAKRIPFTALDISPEQIEVVERFGSKVFYGDASRLDILTAAQADRARAFVLAIDDMDASVRTAAVVRENFPKLAIYARARNRTHVHRLMDLGVTVIRRETFLSSLDLSRELLRGLGYSERDVRFAIDTFKDHDERRLVDDYRHYTDEEKLRDRARSDAANLEKLFDEDASEQARAAAEATLPVRMKERAS